MPDLHKPIIIIGTGRCGSSIFHKILSHHPRVTWLSPYADKHPAKLARNRLAMRALHLPFVNGLIRKRVYPVEGYVFWDKYSPGFSEPWRDLVEGDLTPSTKVRLQKILPQLVIGRRDRLLLKVTGWPRIGFLKAVMPSARIIHVYRDGRAVVNSLMAVPWWSGWRGPENWRWGELTPAFRAKWERFDRSFVALAAIEWEILMQAHEDARQVVPSEDYLSLSYEDLCLSPLEQVRRAADFCGLEWTTEFQRDVNRMKMRNTNFKWRKELTEKQQVLLNDCLSDSLARYGYGP